MSEFRIPTMTKRVTLTNLAIDGSFEDALNNWNCWLAEPTDTSQAKDGSRSLKLGGDALAGSKAAVHLITGHKYYGREYIKTAGELTAADCRFEFCGAVDGVEKAFVFGWNRGNYPDWTAISGIITSDGTYDFGLRTFTVAGSCNAWVDCITVIDLTEACGAGNEPSKEWCDANIPYFSGSYEVDILVSTPIQALVTGLTIPVPQTIVPETNDIYYSADAELNRITSGETYIVTVDGVKYKCVAFNYNSAWGDYYTALGDTRIETDEDGVPDNSHPEDVPFLVQHVIEEDGFGLNFISKYWLIHADEGNHTIKIEELTDKAVTQITDASGRVLWSGRELIQGSMILRPSADISVGHSLVPTNSKTAYLLINEEESDNGSTYIKANSIYLVSESKFALSNTSQLEVSQLTVTSVTICADSYDFSGRSTDSYNEFVLEINGKETVAYRVTSMKILTSISVPEAIPLINEVVANTGTLPSINITIRSKGGQYTSSGSMGGSSKTEDELPDVTQVYVTLGYEGY